MSNDRELRIILKADGSSAVKEIGKVGDEITGLGNSSSKTEKQVERLDKDVSNISNTAKSTGINLTKLNSDILRLGQSNQKTSILTRNLSTDLKTVGDKWMDLATPINQTLGVIQSAAAAMSKAWDFALQGAKFDETSEAFENYADSIGKNSDVILTKLRQASGGTITDMNLMMTASKAMSLGVTTDADKMASLLEVARNKARFYGVETTQAFEEIVTGIGRGSIEILDNLGIRLPAGFRELTQNMSATEKVARLLESTLAAGQKELSNMGGLVDSDADKFRIFSAKVSNLTTNLGTLAEKAILPLVDVLNTKLFPAVDDIVSLFGVWETSSELINKNLSNVGFLGEEEELHQRIESLESEIAKAGRAHYLAARGELNGTTKEMYGRNYVGAANATEEEIKKGAFIIFKQLLEELNIAKSQLEELKQKRKELHEQQKKDIEKGQNKSTSNGNIITNGSDLDQIEKHIEKLGELSKSGIFAALNASKMDLKDATELMYKAGLAASGFAVGLKDVNPELGKYLDEMKTLADKESELSAVLDTLRNIASLDFSKTAESINFVSNIPATITTLNMMNQLSGGFLAAEGVKPVTHESAAAQMVYATSGGLIGNFGKNTFEQAFKERFSSIKDSAKEVESEFKDAIANAINDGFARADFSGFAQSLSSGISGLVGGALGDTVSSIMNQKNMGTLSSGGSSLFKPVYTESKSGGSSLNWGNLGTNLLVGGALSFLTKPGSIFGSRKIIGKENIEKSAELNKQVDQAEEIRNDIFLAVGISDITRQLLNDAEFAKTYVTKHKSKNFFKRETKYKLQNQEAAMASVENIEDLQQHVIDQQTLRNYNIFNTGRGDSIEAAEMSLNDAKSAYNASRYNSDRYSQAERTEMLKQLKDAEIALVNTREDARSNLANTFLSSTTLASMVDQASVNITKQIGYKTSRNFFHRTKTPIYEHSEVKLTDMLLGNADVAGDKEMISAMLPMMKEAGYKDYNLARAFNDAGSDPEKLLEATKSQQSILENALSTYEKMSKDAESEALNSKLSVEEQSAAFERWQQSFDTFLDIQEKIYQNTQTIADIEKQNVMSKLTTELGDMLSIMVEVVRQTSGGGDTFFYSQNLTLEEFTEKLLQVAENKDPKTAEALKGIITNINDSSVWGHL